MLLDWKIIIENVCIWKAIYRFNALPIKVLMTFFTELEQIISKCISNYRRLWITKEILRRKSKAVGMMVPNFRLYYKATLIKIGCYWHK